MIRDHFRLGVVDLSVDKDKIIAHEGRDEFVGGGGLAALLFNQYGHADRPWNDQGQPLIFAMGPLTGYFPLMSKAVCAFKSPYHDITRQVFHNRLPFVLLFINQFTGMKTSQ